jgi:hypothetical protein
MPGESKLRVDRWSDCSDQAGGLIIKPDGSIILDDSSLDNLLLDPTDPLV